MFRSLLRPYLSIDRDTLDRILKIDKGFSEGNERADAIFCEKTTKK